MQISKCSSDLLKTALAPAQQAAPEPGTRDNKQVAEAIANAATAMGLIAKVYPNGKFGNETSYAVYCDGRKGEIEIKYFVNAHGNVEGKVYPTTGGDKMFAGGLQLMRSIMADAVRDSGIGALPMKRSVDPLVAMDPNIYRQQAAQHQAGQTQAPSAEAK